jgi:hypothetical protein
MSYRLKRRSDGAGDSGSLLQLLSPDESNKKVKYEKDVMPRPGVCVRVGSPFARTYSHQDYWTTSYVERIVSSEPHHVVFETRSGQTYDLYID